MSADDFAAFCNEREQGRQPLVVPMVLLAVLMMSSFALWDIAREEKFGTSATTRLAGAVVVMVLLLVMRGFRLGALRVQVLMIYVAFYAWQLAVGRTLGTDAPLQLPGLLIIMFASALALVHARDTRINLLLAVLSVPAVLPPDPGLEEWLYVSGLFGAAIAIAYTLSAQIERSHAMGFVFQMRLQREASTDPLTGLHNRRVFDAVLRREMGRSVRTHEALSIAIIDIDHFKEVNDRFGHDAGDEVLRTTSEFLRINAREVDVLVRLGGEEFGLVMMATTLGDAVRIVERLRLAVEAHVFTYGAAEFRCTVSAGVAEILPDDLGWDAIYRRADRALYAAKGNGRNTVRAAGEDPLIR